MGAFSGSINVKRLRVDGPDPGADGRLGLLRGLRLHAAPDVSPDNSGDARLRTAGFVVAGRPLDMEFTSESVFFGDYLVCAYRVQTLNPPAALVAAETHRREDAAVRERGGTAFTRRERAELKQSVRQELTRKMLPAMQVTDIVWHFPSGRVYVWTHSPGRLDEIAEAFLRAFSRVLLAEDPYFMAECLEDVDDSALRAAMPATFAGEV